jgi:purine-nucleoside phosphorylase
VRLISLLGTKILLLTNAAGSINPLFAPGEWMMLSDHINFTGVSPLSGGPNFFDMSEVYDKSLRVAIHTVTAESGSALREGVYACMPGPQYETPAEVRMLRTLGADAVGMSTVLEAIQARALGLRVGAFSCLTNWAAGMSGEPLAHSEVVETCRVAATALGNLLATALRRGLPGV